MFYGAGDWIKLTLVNVRLVNGNARDTSERRLRAAVVQWCLLASPAKEERGCWGVAAAWDPLVRNKLLARCWGGWLGHQRVLPDGHGPLLPGPATSPPMAVACPADGGAILLEDGASLSLTNCALERNWARNGGAVEVAVGPFVGGGGAREGGHCSMQHRCLPLHLFTSSVPCGWGTGGRGYGRPFPECLSLPRLSLLAPHVPLLVAVNPVVLRSTGVPHPKFP